MGVVAAAGRQVLSLVVLETKETTVVRGITLAVRLSQAVAVVELRRLAPLQLAEVMAVVVSHGSMENLEAIPNWVAGVVAVLTGLRRLELLLLVVVAVLWGQQGPLEH